ncbi:hypothetical protein BCR34DRAFT_240702 [Clohesyomyces aquaticus]|uniref:G-patch domain-containing protein n=1 Tax=Clohesyomyces aquaticus TaxID=1231657 RepID=A0A1Y1ZVB4_9PLEO|nr:hypothetical protein BCR34DRAFT_240702 [Clohesyomyces aquaticus]
MNSEAYLKRQGWRGSGHSLDHRGTGIKKPLLISHKRDQLGLGKKSAAHNVSDQWWMRAFDESLKNVGSGNQSTLSQVRKTGINRGGLYGFFVRGEGLTGTISTTEESSAAEASLTNTSTPPSRTSTPPTSTVESPDESDSASESPQDTDSASEASASSDAMSESAPEVGQPASSSKKRKRTDEGLDTIKKKRKEFQKEARAIVKRQRTEAQHEKALAKGQIKHVPAQETSTMRLIDIEVQALIKQRKARGEFQPVIGDGGKESKKDKFARQKALRDAKSSIKKALIEKALAQGELPNLNNYTATDILENYEYESGMQTKQKKQEKQRLKDLKAENRAYKQAQKKLQKAERRAEKLKQVRETAEKVKAARNQKHGAHEAVASEDIILLPSQKKVPHYGYVDKYPSKAEKRARKEAVQAEAAAQQLLQEKVAAKLANLSDKERVQYQSRADLKSQSIEEYVLRRIQKKDEKRAEAAGEKAPVTTTDSKLESENTPVAAEETKTEAVPPPLFFVDTEGDKTLAQNPTSLPIPLPDPKRPVKSLTKEERKARLQHMREQRAKRKGLDISELSAAAPPSRAARKNDARNRIVAQILLEQGIEKGATKEEREQARTLAKKRMKEEKKQKKVEEKAEKADRKQKGVRKKKRTWAGRNDSG